MKYRKNTESKNSKVAKANKGKLMLLSKCTGYDSKKSRFIKEQEASTLIRSLGLKTVLSRVNKFLLVGDKFMPVMQLKQT